MSQRIVLIYYYVKLTLQFASKDKSLREETLQTLKGYNSHSLITQAKMTEEKVAKSPASEKKYKARVENTELSCQIRMKKKSAMENS